MSQKKFKAPVDHKYFVITGQFLNTIFEGGSVALSLGYTDHHGKIKDNTQSSNQKGRYVEYVTSLDDRGRNKAKRFRFSEELRRLMTRPSDTDIYGRSQYDFLKNHPGCEGSPNGTYETDGNGLSVQIGVVFKEMDAAKDAKTALEADKLVTEAKTNALSLDDTTLAEIANIIGYYGDVDDLMRLKVVEYAGKKPSEFKTLLNSGDRSLRAIIRKALQENVFTQKGEMIYWDNLLIGSSEDAAIKTLTDDKDMFNALQEKFQLNLEPVKKTRQTNK